MSFLKSLFGQSKDDRLFNEFLKAMQQMDAQQAEKCIDQMSDEGLIKATVEIDNRIKKNPSYMIYNTLLYAAFAKRPHLRNPFM